MKRHSVIRRCVLAAGLGLLLVGILAVSLGWATIWPSPPVAALQTRAGGDVASPAAPALPGESTSGRAAQPVRADAGRSTQDISAKAAPPQPDAGRAVHDAWQRARDAGSYNFATDLSQVSYPARSLANAGRGPSRADIHVEGEIDQPARTLAFRMWEPGSAGTGEQATSKRPAAKPRRASRATAPMCARPAASGKRSRISAPASRPTTTPWPTSPASRTCARCRLRPPFRGARG